MKSALIAAVLAVGLPVTGGCTTYKSSRMLAKVGGLMMASGAGVGLTGWGYESAPLFLTGVVAVPVGAIIGGLGLIGCVVFDKPLRDEAREEEENEEARDAQTARYEQAVLNEQAARERAARDEQAAREQTARDEQARRDQAARGPCLRQRVERLRETNKITDVEVRARMLRSIPACAPTDPVPPAQ